MTKLVMDEGPPLAPSNPLKPADKIAKQRAHGYLALWLRVVSTDEKADWLCPSAHQFTVGPLLHQELTIQ